MFDKKNKNELLDEHLMNVLDEKTTLDRYIWIRAAVFLLIGGLIGGVSVLFRPYFDDGVHIEAVVALAILIGVNIGLLIYFIRNKRKRYKFAYFLCVCAIWTGYAIGWLSLAVYFLDDVITMSIMFALCTLAIGNVAFYLHEKWSTAR